MIIETDEVDETERAIVWKICEIDETDETKKKRLGDEWDRGWVKRATV